MKHPSAAQLDAPQRRSSAAARGMARWLAGPLLAWLALFSASAALAQPFQAASDGRHFWLVTQAHADQEVNLHYISPDGLSGGVRLVQRMRGRLANGGIAAGQNRLWLVYRDHTVQTISVGYDRTSKRWLHSATIRRALPGGVDLRGLAADATGPWALVRVGNAETLERLRRGVTKPGASQAKRNDDLARAIGLPPGVVLSDPDRPRQTDEAKDQSTPDEDDAQPAADAEADAPDEGDDTPPAEDDGAGPAAPEPDAPTDAQLQAGDDSAEATMPVDRLLHLVSGAWELVDLPEDWPNGAPALIAADPARRGAIHLLTWDDRDAKALTVFTREGDAWIQYEHELDDLDTPRAFVADGQLILARPLPGGGPPARLDLLRREHRYPIGQLGLELNTTFVWDLAGLGQSVVLAAMPRDVAAEDWEGGLRAAQIGFDGHVQFGLGPVPVAEDPTPSLPPDYIVLIVVLVVSTVLMFAFWRRDDRSELASVPDGLALCPALRRYVAGLIDIAVIAAPIMLVFGEDLQTFALHWPGQGGSESWLDLLPGGIAIAGYIAHTTISELITGRTFGKAIFGIRVLSQQGGKAKPGQILIRGGMKAFDVIAWPLLLLPVVTPLRQRLGDLVARTIVLCPPPAPSDDEDDSNQGD